MILVRAGAASVALLLAGCGGDGPSPAANAVEGNQATAPEAAAAAPAEQASTLDPTGLVVPANWMPADWDREVYSGSGELVDAETILKSRQNMMNTVPFTLWALANDTRVTEAFEPIWVWYSAIRSCANGIELNDDLAGEFGNRERGKAGLTKSRSDLKAWAATQPRELTLYFTAKLGQWNGASGTFQLQSPGTATTLKPQDIDAIDPYPDGANVELWSDRSGQAINHFQASLVAPQCVSADKTKLYKFQRQSQWWVVFGDVDRGMGGLTNYKSREMLPAITMTRGDAANFAQRNPQRKVVVAVTFAPVGSSFVKGVDQSAIRAKFRQVTITDAADGSALASKTY
ncbi:MAG: hypothetical protein EOP62_20320 [Sphingomonadales bacterium]|nr:MAG: hypothetical protein EOP62_20320 [Sphingomonadales bacterium]